MKSNSHPNLLGQTPISSDGFHGEASVLELVDKQYQYAAGNLRLVTLGFEPVAAITSACGRIFREVDREDEEQRRVARLAWQVKSTILQTLISFDDPRLGISEFVSSLQRAAEVVPGTRHAAELLARILLALLSAPKNPKREWFLEYLATRASPQKGTTVLAALQGASTPGWPTNISPGDDLGSETIVLTRTRKDLRGRVFDSGVITGTTRFTSRPLIHDLLYGGRAREVIVLSYKHEFAYVPEPIKLPANAVFKARELSPAVAVESAGDNAEVQLDSWANESLWHEIRARQADMAPESDRDVTVAARFVLFADGSGAFLPDERRVVEISDLLDAGGSLGAADDQLPRKAVRDLEEGDLVLLRLIGGGHYVEDVADSLMAKAGCDGLRQVATEWKERLHRVLKQHGEGFVATTARGLGLRLRYANYLWVWAGDAVMAPHDFPTFRALIAAVARLDPHSSPVDVDAYAADKWQHMEQLKSFHIRAGTVIRNALLERVKAYVAERRSVTTVDSIELPGVAAGRMGLLRVSAVDSRPMRIPLSRLFHITPVRAA